MAETITKSLLLEPYSIYNIYTTKVLFKFEKVRGILQQMPTRWLVWGSYKWLRWICGHCCSHLQYMSRRTHLWCCLGEMGYMPSPCPTHMTVSPAPVHRLKHKAKKNIAS